MDASDTYEKMKELMLLKCHLIIEDINYKSIRIKL